MNDSDKIYINCRYGHGRTAVAACIFLMELDCNITANNALIMVSDAHQRIPLMKLKYKNKGAPENIKQKKYVINFYH